MPSLKAGEAPNLISDPVHSMYCGVTQSGKTTLARLHARLLERMEWPCIVYDPVQTGTLGGDPEYPWGENAVVFDDPEKLMRYLEKEDVHGAFVFIDEADTVLGHLWQENHWLLTRGRHKGLYIRLITQRPKLVPPSVRNQCSICYQFRLTLKDSKEILADFGHDEASVERALGTPLETSDPDGDNTTLSGPLDLDMGDFLVCYSGSKVIDKANVYKILNSRSHPLNKGAKRKDE